MFILSRNGFISLVGILLGLLHTGLFFQLTFTFSSGFGTYLLITLCWLLGSVIGIGISPYVKIPINVYLIIALLTYTICGVLLSFNAFNTRMGVVYGLLIIFAGVYPGVFFARIGSSDSTRALFLWENNGFLLGLVSGTILFMVLGRPILWIAPLLVGGLILVSKLADQNQKIETMEEAVAPSIE